MVKWRWLCTRCRRCCYYCVLCTVSVAVLLVVTGSLGVNKMILFRAGLVHGDEMAADIPLETQGKLHFSQDESRQEIPAPGKHVPHSSSSSDSPSLPSQPAVDRHLNCSPHSHVKILLFIRLPKCASTSFVDLLQKLSKQLNFYLEFNPSGAYNWNKDETISVAQQISIAGYSREILSTPVTFISSILRNTTLKTLLT
ncbi:hypothetical protein GBAR_LOCUS22815 [Geodia barretti]|uniref:Uncharacterized protein n=1 Tax=Geodia barretti TaxID=519541 RepID=A0AA35X804_GEOBA|nr:hypothetical protein GBAR_LOCUS22815 [Geodia barretti]